MEKVILFGASGQQGSVIAQQLIEKGYKVIAPVRYQTNVESLNHKRIETRLTDFTTASLTNIIKEADKVILQVPVVITPAQMIEFVENALKAIAQAGSPHTVFSISSVVPIEFIGLNGPDARLKMKELTKQILPSAIILSSTLYLENFSQAYRQAIEQGGVIPQAIPTDIPVAYLSFSDLAMYILAALEKLELKGQFIPIGGSEALTGIELSKKLGVVLGKYIHYQGITSQELTAFLTPMIGEQTALQVAEMYEWEGTTGGSLLNPDVKKALQLFGITLPDFDTWAKSAFKKIK
ncbi:hypothetical protein CHU92_00335 [Flavobacterium cyanobacteriorum]|uniref:NmrA-like domain-containing protein n=1 Tax=Flavobacterium cyanobacteriorum TaxID=2022802 RepID=A0A256A6A8_9FLAO|nr:NmrA family NAD(P)-binding protein [Flavobacterium cyanobacteriorum]OYQ49298.1 hypothetical protein CHU92_00335 [Flavobacterium cyanobacteriorum]